MPNSAIRLRYKDVLMALEVAGTYDCSLGRLQLQKYIYLSDTLSLIWEIIGTNKGHETYKRGPYDQAIQNAVDILAFRGLVALDDFEIQQDGNVRVKYKITTTGRKFIDKISEVPTLGERFIMYKEIGKEINLRGWGQLKALVYAEPTFVTQKSLGWGNQLPLNSLLSNLSLQLIKMFKNISLTLDSDISKENLIGLYFQLLDEVLLLDKGNDHEEGYN